MNIDLIEAGGAHAPLIAELHNRVMGEAWSADSVVRLLSLPGAFAFLAGPAGAPEAAVLCVPGGAGVEIATLVVLDAARGRGLGARLLRAAAARARASGAKAIELEVREDNGPALGLYRQSGFAETGRRGGYYRPRGGRPGADAVLMRLDLWDESA